MLLLSGVVACSGPASKAPTQGQSPLASADVPAEQAAAPVVAKLSENPIDYASEHAWIGLPGRDDAPDILPIPVRVGPAPEDCHPGDEGQVEEAGRGEVDADHDDDDHDDDDDDAKHDAKGKARGPTRAGALPQPKAPRTLPAAAQVFGEAEALADTFFVHGTTWEGPAGSHAWREAVEASTRSELLVAYQASAFNGVTRVFAPRYRQVSRRTLREERGAQTRTALSLAYRDVQAAFDHYLSTHAEERPLVLAGQGQGSLHIIRLLRERFERPELARRLVVVYLDGVFIDAQAVAPFPVCETLSQRQCVVSWVAARAGQDVRHACGSVGHDRCVNALQGLRQGAPVCVNPVTWIRGGSSALTQHLGAGPGSGPDGGHIEGIRSALLRTWCDDAGVLRVAEGELEHPPQRLAFPGPIDEGLAYTLFWMDIRHNVAQRLNAAF